jgi:antitoxin component YwqK of YwqJK toxin-antitoxin module
MKALLIIFSIILIGNHLNAQIPEVKKKDSCHLRYDTLGNVLKRNRYAEWECGKLVGVINCNEKLEYDEASDMVFLNNSDLTNAAGANKPFNGRCETCHMNGELERRVTFVGGKEHGTDTTYYSTGCPQVVRTHINGVENGQWKYFYDSTEYLAWEMNYMFGKKHGKHIFMKKKGDTTKWENYSNGLLDGIKRTYYPGSKIKREVNYKEGIMHGTFKIYNIEGVVIEELNYKQGKKHDECKYFYDDGKPLKIEHWSMGVKNGEFKVFFYQGAVQTVEVYDKRGNKEGWFIEYYPDSKTKLKILYEKGVLVEEYRYDEHGRETYSFPERTGDEMEDDEMPGGKKRKKKKKKKD